MLNNSTRSAAKTFAPAKLTAEQGRTQRQVHHPEHGRADDGIERRACQEGGQAGLGGEDHFERAQYLATRVVFEMVFRAIPMYMVKKRPN